MNPNVLKLPSYFLNKHFCRVLPRRPFSSGEKNKRKRRSSLSPTSQTLRKVNILGSLGIASALLVSYYVVKKAQKTHSVFTLEKSKKKGILVDPHLLNSTLSKPEGKEPLRDQYNFIKKVVNECAGAVFYLELRDPYMKDPETGQAIVTSNGSGFIINEDGWALTNAHVVLNRPQSTITAIMKDGRSFNVKVEDADLNIDIALLKLEANEKLPCLEFGESGDTAVGEWVVALGSPLSLSNSVTVGIISSVDRPAEELGLKNYSMTYIQTDASITFGNSGGPLVNLDGNVIGINNLRLTSGISFAIPIEYAKRFLENSKYRVQKAIGATGNRIGKALFGLTTISITPELLVNMNKENSKIPKEITHGLLVWKIIPGTPAHKSGLEVGDIITHVNGIPIQKPAELYNFSSNRNTIEIEIINKGEKKNVILTLD